MVELGDNMALATHTAEAEIVWQVDGSDTEAVDRVGVEVLAAALVAAGEAAWVVQQGLPAFADPG